MPGGAAAVVPRMPFRAAGAVAAAVLRIPGKGTKIFFAGKIRSRFSAGAVARTRPFTPDMSEFCRLRVVPGRPIARRSSGSGHTPDARRPAPGARRPTPDARLRLRSHARHRTVQRGPALFRIPALFCCPFRGRSPCPGALRTNAFFAVCGRKRFILGEFGNFVTFAPNFKPKQQWHINYSKVRKA